MSKINFFTEDIEFTLNKKDKIRQWINYTAKSERYTIDTINYIFCSDDYLLNINKEYLDHDYYTDIITFDNSEEEDKVLSDIFISIDRVKDNAENSQLNFDQELHRVIIHGLLHLIGYNDKNEEDKITMRSKEDHCLTLLN